MTIDNDLQKIEVGNLSATLDTLIESMIGVTDKLLVIDTRLSAIESRLTGLNHRLESPVIEPPVVEKTKIVSYSTKMLGRAAEFNKLVESGEHKDWVASRAIAFVGLSNQDYYSMLNDGIIKKPWHVALRGSRRSKRVSS